MEKEISSARKIKIWVMFAAGLLVYAVVVIWLWFWLFPEYGSSSENERRLGMPGLYIERDAGEVKVKRSNL